MTSPSRRGSDRLHRDAATRWLRATRPGLLSGSSNFRQFTMIYVGSSRNIELCCTKASDCEPRLTPSPPSILIVPRCIRRIASHKPGLAPPRLHVLRVRARAEQSGAPRRGPGRWLPLAAYPSSWAAGSNARPRGAIQAEKETIKWIREARGKQGRSDRVGTGELAWSDRSWLIPPRPPRHRVPTQLDWLFELY